MLPYWRMVSSPESVGQVLELWVLVVDVRDGNVEHGRAPLLTLVLRLDGLTKPNQTLVT